MVNWLEVAVCLVSAFVKSLPVVSQACSEGSCQREVTAQSGQDVSLVCSGDCRSFPAWCTRHHDGYALVQDQLFSITWFKNEQEINTSYSNCLFTSCQGFHLELEGRSLLLANVTPDMSGNYTCRVNYWYNGSCCPDVPNYDTSITVQQVCKKSYGYDNVTGFFFVNITDRGVEHNWTYEKPVYPWVMSSVIFGDQPTLPLVSAMHLSVSHHRPFYPPFKFSYWKRGERTLWYVMGVGRKEQTLTVYKILQVGENVGFSCVPDCGYPMPEQVTWYFGVPGSSLGRDVNIYRSPERSFLQRRWNLLVQNVSRSLAFTWLTCALNNSVEEPTPFPSATSMGGINVHYFLEVNDTSEKSGFDWGPSVPRVSHSVENALYGFRPKLCIDVLHNPSHGRLFVGCYGMETKCAPACKKYRTVTYQMNKTDENITSQLKLFMICGEPFEGLTRNFSYVWEAYQLRNPWAVLHHTIDYRVARTYIDKTEKTTESINTGHLILIGLVVFAIVAVFVGYLVFRYKKKYSSTRPILLKTDDNPMYGHVDEESDMGSPRSATTAFSFVPPDGQSNTERHLSQSPSTDLEIPSYIIPCDEWEFSRNKVIKERMIGSGEFGEVFQGKLLTNDERDVINVAIKMTKEDATSKEVLDLKSELKLLKEITALGGHPNVIRLIGSCTLEEPLMVLTEYAVHGDLKNYLVLNRMKHSDMPKYERDSLFIGYCTDIAAGMEYLSSKKIVHRDLAARNVLVFEDLTMKITDFGLTKYLMDKPYYRVCNHTLLPVKWMAPECIQFKKFTHMSDVWSYGVVVWEVCSNGETPYAEIIEQGELLRHLVAGQILLPPPDSPPVLKAMMERTWLLDPCQRPTFQEIFELLTTFIKNEKNSSSC